MASSGAVQASSPGKHLPASPHGEIEEVFAGIWFVRGGVKMPMLLPMKIGRSMTVVRGNGNELTLFNTMRLTEPGLARLESLGEVRHVVRLAGFHGRDDGFYRDRYGARIHAIAGQAYVRGLDGKSTAEPYLQPDEWLEEGRALPIADAELKVFVSSSPPEALCLLRREGGILITGDSLQHTPTADEYFNFPAKIMMKRFGFFKAHNVGPGWLQFAHPSISDVRSILDLDFAHVLPGHGHAVIGDAKAKFRPSIEGELKGCHT